MCLFVLLGRLKCLACSSIHTSWSPRQAPTAPPLARSFAKSVIAFFQTAARHALMRASSTVTWWQRLAVKGSSLQTIPTMMRTLVSANNLPRLQLLLGAVPMPQWLLSRHPHRRAASAFVWPLCFVPSARFNATHRSQGMPTMRMMREPAWLGNRGAATTAMGGSCHLCRAAYPLLATRLPATAARAVGTCLPTQTATWNQVGSCLLLEYVIGAALAMSANASRPPNTCLPVIKKLRSHSKAAAWHI